MKLIIADDFTGAAEIAGIGLRYGLKLKICRTSNSLEHDVNGIILDTDTRAKPSTEIASSFQPFIEKLKQGDYRLIYKKTDSVLRGHVRLELELLLEYLMIPRILLVPANPSRKRIIRNGVFFIDEQPLHKTEFANGFVKNLFEGQVLKLLGKSKKFPITLIKPGEKLPPSGIIVGEAQSKEDLIFWANEVDESMLPAGGAEFFSTLLSRQKGQNFQPQNVKLSVNFTDKKLFFILASTSQYSQQFLQKLDKFGVTACLFPRKLTEQNAFSSLVIDEWFHCLKKAFQKNKRVALAVGQKVIKDRMVSRKLSGTIARVTKKVIKELAPDVMLVEGGSTAAAIFNLLNLNSFIPEVELIPGVVQVRSPELSDKMVIVKPGSYQWPEVIWKNQ